MLLHLFNSILGLVLLYETFVVISHMGRKTPHTIRMAYVLVVSGAFAAVIDPLFYKESDIGLTLLMAGFVLLVYVERRASSFFSMVNKRVS